MTVKRLPKLDPKQTKLEDLLERLELYEGAWAIDINGYYFVFPKHQTRAECERVLKEGLALARGETAN